MERHESLRETFSLFLRPHFNILVHSDGGARTNCSSAAWVAEIASWEAETGELRVETLAYSATYINCWISSFIAEAMAPYQAEDFVSNFIWKHRS